MLQPGLDVVLVEVELRLHKVMEVASCSCAGGAYTGSTQGGGTIPAGGVFGVGAPTFETLKRSLGKVFSRACFGGGPS